MNFVCCLTCWTTLDFFLTKFFRQRLMPMHLALLHEVFGSLDRRQPPAAQPSTVLVEMLWECLFFGVCGVRTTGDASQVSTCGCSWYRSKPKTTNQTQSRPPSLTPTSIGWVPCLQVLKQQGAKPCNVSELSQCEKLRGSGQRILQILKTGLGFRGFRGLGVWGV